MKQGIWMGRDAAILKPCFPHPTPRSGAQRESAAGAFGHVVSDGGYAMEYPATALAENPAALVLSQGKAVLCAGQGAYSELQAETGWGRRGGLTGSMRQYCNM